MVQFILVDCIILECFEFLFDSGLSDLLFVRRRNTNKYWFREFRTREKFMGFFVQKRNHAWHIRMKKGGWIWMNSYLSNSNLFINELDRSWESSRSRKLPCSASLQNNFHCSKPNFSHLFFLLCSLLRRFIGVCELSTLSWSWNWNIYFFQGGNHWSESKCLLNAPFHTQTWFLKKCTIYIIICVHAYLHLVSNILKMTDK